uniref:Putative reverse transcriptase domain-containing protein n=1 Tax=Tanacetum cinerariifolium TaxID=118510 RepID=A0A6L2MPP9_TANCI|nr:putative reverse transcriptase domain-containing protein [Tanacetum cinerariifolium]
MRRLEATFTYTDDEINRLARGGKHRGHVSGVGRVLPARATASPSTPAHESTLNSLHKKVDFMMRLFKSDSKYSYMFSQFESGGASGSGGCGDDEERADHQDDKDEDGDGQPPVSAPPPQGYPPQEGYAKDAYPPQGYPPSGYPPQQQAYPAQGYPQQQYPPQYAPQYAQPPPQQQKQNSSTGCLEGCGCVGQWLYGKCTTLHVVTRACHHPDGLVRFSIGSDNMSGYIVGISKPSNKEIEINVTEGLVLDVKLLDRVFKVPITTVCRPNNRQERMSGNRKSLQQSSILKSLATWGKDDGITTLVKIMLYGSGLESVGHGGGDFLEVKTTGNTNIRQCLRKVADGYFTEAVKVLSFFEIDSVFGCIKSLSKGTSCGRDGLRAQHILDVLCGEGYVTATNLLKVITSVVNMWLAGRCSSVLAEFVASAPLTPLLNPDNEIRPIVVGIIWRRLISKVAMKGLGKEMSKYLSDFQFGVRVSSDVEAVLHSVNRVVSGYHSEGSLAMLIVDFSVHKIRDNCKLLFHAWYLDDGTIIRDSKEVARVLETTRRPLLGVKLLGGAVSRDADFISGLAIRRAANAVDLMGLLLQLHDPLYTWRMRPCSLTKDCVDRSRTWSFVKGLPLGTYSGDLLLYPFDLVVWVCTRKKRIPFMLSWPQGHNLGCYKTAS